ncbi:sigma-54-dependent transcriptional regulator [Myxococcus sp. Y35]|uniref:sigma-54-dependent transcriptional regulator n=1 Tax=Pseudomyxococcus flavus TaxID=3115648 RepID=UPI003CE97611
MPGPLLYVDDEPSNLEVFRLTFEESFAVHTAPNAREALQQMEHERVAVVLTDERMPGMSGIELLARVMERWPDTGRIIVSAYADADRLLRAITQGRAHEYVLKPWRPEELRACIERCLTMAERLRELVARADLGEVLREQERERHDPGHLVGADGGLQATVHSARRAALSDATVLIHGETGTGKEVIARLIHESSTRSRGPFVRVNCAALAEGVLESELFGHEQGAFTGALRMKRGRFELADGGTLFLDEVGDMSPKLQVSLLRVLQEREFERVGGTKTLKTDVRVVAATHRDLLKLVLEGRFREDLYYRLNVLPIRVPPLRERVEDLDALLTHFISRYAPAGTRPAVAPGVVEGLSRYRWPGNVRELENLVQRAVVLSQGDVLTLDDFSLTFSVPEVPPAVPGVREQVRQSEQEQLRQLLVSHGGNFAGAARTLGVPRTTLISRAKKYGLL